MFVDTSVLIRTLQPQHALYPVAMNTIHRLLAQQPIHIVPQNLYELWVVATRPTNVNGLGMSHSAAHQEILNLRQMFRFLSDTPAVYDEWQTLVHQHNIVGKSAHDARLVAAMKAHGLTAVLTFDPAVFARFSGMQVLVPQP